MSDNNGISFSENNSVLGDEENENAAVQESQDPVRRLNANVPSSDLNHELGQSFINYAMSVIKDRALPDVRDGLKPVHRRVLFDMKDLGVTHKSPTKKSARIVGDVIGRFHPHGDTAVYETIVRMAQWFSMRETLIFGQGNFGDIDGDGAAAMRYTEVRLTRIATETLLDDLNENIVDFEPNYDGSESIASVLPAKYPNLLVNGGSGIAVGMATNIPTHNLTEVLNSCIVLLDKPDMSLDELMTTEGCIKGPDFPTGGTIVGNGGIREAYMTGKGRCIIRAKSHTEYDKKGNPKAIIVDEIPYVVHKIDIIRQIRDLLRDDREKSREKESKKVVQLDGIKEVNDLSDKDNAVKIEIVLKAGAFPEAVLNNLYQKTSMQSSFPINMVALSRGKPKLFSLLEILKEFLDFRRNVITRRTSYWLKNAKKDAHTQEGLLVAKANIDRVIELITSSANTEEAKAKLVAEAWDGGLINTLIERTEDGVNIALPLGIPKNKGYIDGKYYLSQEQAESILRLQLARLTHLAQDEIRDLYKKLLADIHDYLDILNNPERLKSEIKKEFIQVRDTFGNPRKTDFTFDVGKFSKYDLVQKRDVIVTLSALGFIKYQEVAEYESQARGGKGKLATKLKGEDYVTQVVVTNTHDKLVFFTNKGRAFVKRVFDLPTYESRSSQGSLIQNILNIDFANDEHISAILPVSEYNSDDFFFMATKKGGVKKTSLSAYASFFERMSNNSILACIVADDDELISVQLSSGDDDIFLFTSDGNCVHFCEYYKKNAENIGNEEEQNQEESVQDDAIVENDDNAEEKSLDRHAGLGVRPKSRNSSTNRGIRLRNDATVVALLVVPPASLEHQQCAIVSANGYVKRFMLNTVAIHNRGGKGMKVLGNLDRNGPVIGAVLADDNSDIMCVTNQGLLIRSPMTDIPLISRTAAGNIMIRMQSGDQVNAVQCISADVVKNTKKLIEARNLEKVQLRNENAEVSSDSVNGELASSNETGSSEEKEPHETNLSHAETSEE